MHLQPTSARPRLKPWYRLALDEASDTLHVRHGATTVTFSGRAATLLLPPLLGLLDGTRTVTELVDRLGPAVEPAITQALARLAEHDLLLDGPSSSAECPDPVRATVDAVSARTEGEIAPEAVLGRLRTAHVAVAGGRVAAEIARLLLRSGVAGVHRTADPEAIDGHGYDLVVVAPDAADDPALGRFNRRALETGQLWMQVLPLDGRRAAVGPLFLPGQTACFECFRIRRAAAGPNRSLDRRWDELADAGHVAPGAAGMADGQVSILAGMATEFAVELLALGERASSPRGGYLRVLTTGAHGPELETHRVFRVPRCPQCSPLNGFGSPQPWHHPLPDELHRRSGDAVLEH